MSTWTLVLIINSFWSSALTTATLPGYTTESNCIVAGNTLLKDKDMNVDIYKCVEVK